jgi:hypothetical protein
MGGCGVAAGTAAGRRGGQQQVKPVKPLRVFLLTNSAPDYARFLLDVAFGAGRWRGGSSRMFDLVPSLRHKYVVDQTSGLDCDLPTILVLSPHAYALE